MPLGVPGHEVPPSAQGDEAVWFYEPDRLVSLAGAVTEPQPFVVAARLSDHRQCVCIDSRTPVERRRHRVRLQRIDTTAQPRRHDLHDLRQCAHRGLTDTGHGGIRGVTQPHRDRHRFLVVQEQRRQCGSGLQLVTAGDASAGLDRIAELAQSLDVAT